MQFIQFIDHPDFIALNLWENYISISVLFHIELHRIHPKVLKIMKMAWGYSITVVLTSRRVCPIPSCKYVPSRMKTFSLIQWSKAGASLLH